MKTIVLMLSMISSVFAFEYKGEYRSYHPVSYYLNASFDVIQNPRWFSQDGYFKNHEILLENILRPKRTIKRDGGFKKLISNEFFSSRIVPNLFLHTIGGAYDFEKIKYSFKQQGVNNDLFWTIALRYAGHFGNEALELSKPDVVNAHDNIADLYFFDVLAILLGQNKTYSRFMTDTLQMRSWHDMPVYLLEQDEPITNAGLHYVIRPKIGEYKIRPFLYFGMQLYTGVSYELKSNEFISIATGIVYDNPLTLEGRWASAFFYDKENALNASLVFNGAEDYRVRLNLFPEIFRFKNLEVGVLLGQKFDRDHVLGLQVNLPLGFGLKN